MNSGTAIATIGNFDGVHAGHRALINAARHLVEQGKADHTVAMVFDPHPASLLRPGAEPERLSTYSQRRRWLLQYGADSVVRLDPSQPLPHAPGRTILQLQPHEFVSWARDTHSVIGFVEGHDFRFGCQRAGTIDDLQRLTGLAHAVDDVSITLKDGRAFPARSGTIRSLLKQGAVEDAARILGRAYHIEGTVIKGQQRGRTIGFPTANILTSHLLPADGVYACTATLPDGAHRSAAVSVGTNPTFSQGHRTLEAHILQTGGPGRLLPGAEGEYGWPIQLRFIARLRSQIPFDGPALLIKQITADCDTVRRVIQNLGAPHRATINV